MFIRSQDKEKLVPVNRICITKAKTGDEYKVVNYHSDSSEYDTLGCYKCKDTAINIISKIQRNINLKYDTFEMPEDIYEGIGEGDKIDLSKGTDCPNCNKSLRFEWDGLNGFKKVAYCCNKKYIIVPSDIWTVESSK